MDLGVPL